MIFAFYDSVLLSTRGFRKLSQDSSQQTLQLMLQDEV